LDVDSMQLMLTH